MTLRDIMVAALAIVVGIGLFSYIQNRHEDDPSRLVHYPNKSVSKVKLEVFMDCSDLVLKSVEDRLVTNAEYDILKHCYFDTEQSKGIYNGN